MARYILYPRRAKIVTDNEIIENVSFNYLRSKIINVWINAD